MLLIVLILLVIILVIFTLTLEKNQADDFLSLIGILIISILTNLNQL